MIAKASQGKTCRISIEQFILSEDELNVKKYELIKIISKGPDDPEKLKKKTLAIQELIK